jgi:hypothetical protein
MEKERARCVYGIFSREGILVYVGQCYIDLIDDRFKRHRRKSEKRNNFKKWKWLHENPDSYITQIDGPYYTIAETHQAEKRIIADNKKKGVELLNLTPGGDYNPMLNEDQEKRNQAIEKIRKAAKMRKHTEQTKDKIRKFMLHSPNRWWTGKKHTDETKMKMREKTKNRKNRPCDENTKQKISAALKGIKRKPLTEEQKQLRREKMKIYWFNKKNK